MADKQEHGPWEKYQQAPAAPAVKKKSFKKIVKWLLVVVLVLWLLAAFSDQHWGTVSLSGLLAVFLVWDPAK